MPFSVLKLLSADEFRSGEEISRCLGLSRASVHNLVERARELGVTIHAVRGRGYRLAERYSWLDGERLAPARTRGFEILLHQEVESTNSLLLGLAQQGQRHKSVLAAEWQSGGRGRRGRTWHAVPGGGLTFSLLWRFNRPLTALSGLSLAIGVALARGLRGLGLAGVGLKWPNDILVGGAKLAGILIETHGDMLSSATAVIGIGINVQARPDDLGPAGYAAVAVEEVLAVRFDRNDLLLRLLAELDEALKTFDGHGFAPFRDEWQALHVWQGRPVQVLGGPAPIDGVAAGVDDNGVLLLATADGVRPIHSGEVSLRAGVAP
ncbi:MAG: biotin--[acetyl-CoA-carboxylase] ligase [Thiobacillus sp.]|nr:biotin--[acetyl-CoA-carboxylase] ligase [Thiobacillus sp.]